MKQKSYTNPALNPTWELRVKETKRGRVGERKAKKNWGKGKKNYGKAKKNYGKAKKNYGKARKNYGKARKN